MALEEGFADILLIGSKDLIEVKSKAAGVDVSKASYIDPKTTDKLNTYVDALVELRKKKGMTQELARATLLSDYTYLFSFLKGCGLTRGKKWVSLLWERPTFATRRK